MFHAPACAVSWKSMSRSKKGSSMGTRNDGWEPCRFNLAMPLSFPLDMRLGHGRWSQMERSKLNVPFAWMVIAYLGLCMVFWWSANQPSAGFAQSVFFLTLFLSWVPAYVYANRRDIACNKAFWFSRAAGLIAGLLMFFLLLYLVGIKDDPDAESSTDLVGWLGGVATYFLSSHFIDSLIKWSAMGTQRAVEQHLENKKD
jgi:hypothetical protein